MPVLCVSQSVRHGSADGMRLAIIDRVALKRDVSIFARGRADRNSACLSTAFLMISTFAIGSRATVGFEYCVDAGATLILQHLMNMLICLGLLPAHVATLDSDDKYVLLLINSRPALRTHSFVPSAVFAVLLTPQREPRAARSTSSVTGNSFF